MQTLPELKLPVWMCQGETAKLANVARQWFTMLGEWALWHVRQLDPMTCSPAVLDLIAWQRDITRFTGESLELFRLRVKYAYANAKDAGSVDGFKKIFERLGVGYVEVDERIPGQDWDVVDIRVSNSQIAGNAVLMDVLVQHYGRTCRRYGWKTVEQISVEIQITSLSNDIHTENIIWEE